MTLFDDKWRFECDIFSETNSVFHEFEKKLQIIDENTLRWERGLCVGIHKPKANLPSNYDADLKLITEKNKELKQTIETRTQEVQERKETLKNYKQSQKLLTEEIKDTYEAFLMGKKFYKKHLKLYLTIKSSTDTHQIVFVQFFTEHKKDTKDYSLLLKKDKKTGKFELLEMSPMLPTFKEIHWQLEQTNDIIGAICFIRQSFVNIRQKK